MSHHLKDVIEDFWEKGDKEFSSILPVIEEIFSSLNQGILRVSEKIDNQWITNAWVKKAILLFLKNSKNHFTNYSPFHAYDKIPLKFSNWLENDFEGNGFRSLPGAIVRSGAYIAPGVVLMPSFINIGAYVGKNTMIDTWSTIGSCAQIGDHCHISGGVGIGGVLEPLQSKPVIIEDHCFIGARSEIAEGMIIGEGAVISMGVFLGASTKIIDRETKEIYQGFVPPYSVVVPGTVPPKKEGDPALACAVIVKKVDEKTRSKTSINTLLRD